MCRNVSSFVCWKSIVVVWVNNQARIHTDTPPLHAPREGETMHKGIQVRKATTDNSALPNSRRTAITEIPTAPCHAATDSSSSTNRHLIDASSHSSPRLVELIKRTRHALVVISDQVANPRKKGPLPPLEPECSVEAQ